MRPPFARRRGFTFVELLVVLVVMAVLASLAIPRLISTRGRAFTATLQTDLGNLAVAEEAYYYQNGEYTSDLSLLFMHPSAGVTMTVSASGAQGWGATAVHPSADRPTCAIFYGSPATRPAPATVEGDIACH